jgi:hypothetical protein
MAVYGMFRSFKSTLKGEAMLSARPANRICRKIIACVVLALTLSLLPVILFAQDAVPKEILQRTIYVKVPGGTATAFEYDFNGTRYLITARHVVAGLPATGATIEIWRANQWLNLRTVKTIFPSSSSVDIAVLETLEKVPVPFPITAPSANESAVTFGQRVWYLGYPLNGLGFRSLSKDVTAPIVTVPLIKSGTLSAIDASDSDAIVLYFDGFENPGFAGGPIIDWNSDKKAYRIIGVVQGYGGENAKVMIKGQQVDASVLASSGIVIGYSIEHAIHAIEESQKEK